ncbi:uncharacterized protein LOC133814831 [Humulus lupulus]|uniref:uncharacterized protein LOC133814831 n=1 Tax=Humulus lupulus TaxID=3486 RepID=UPI002B4006BF|nr:uncharacterized protein LOC133814831 [Humulus lupulus]
MDSEDMFEHYRAVAASSSQKKNSKRARGESSKTASKKAQTDDPPAIAPSKENSPPSSPLEQPASTLSVEQTSNPATPIDQQPSPKAPSSQTLCTPLEGSLPNIVVSSARERIYKLSKHKRSQASITKTTSMEANQVLNRGLNEIGLLTITAGWRRAGALVSRGKNFDTRLAEAKKSLEAKNNELTKQNGEFLAEKTELSKQKEELLEQKATLTEELLETRNALKKSNEAREKFRESSTLKNQQAVQLELDMIASRQEAEELEKRVKELEEAGAKNLEKYKECALRLEEEERAEVLASPEISLAAGIDGADIEAGTAIDQDVPQDPPAP